MNSLVAYFSLKSINVTITPPPTLELSKYLI